MVLILCIEFRNPSFELLLIGTEFRILSFGLLLIGNEFRSPSLALLPGVCECQMRRGEATGKAGRVEGGARAWARGGESVHGVVWYWEFVSTDAKRRNAGGEGEGVSEGKGGYVWCAVLGVCEYRREEARRGGGRAWASGGEGVPVVALNLEFATVRCEEVRRRGRRGGRGEEKEPGAVL